MSEATDAATQPTVTVGNYPLVTPNTAPQRMSILLWGASGCGKSTLAATAPGRKLWILFDPDGANSLRGRNDVLVLDLSGERHQIVVKFKDDNPLLIEKLLRDNPDIETVVFDSVTAFSILATENAVSIVKSATIENPGLKGYGHRNAVVLRACVSLLRLTKRMNRHIVIIAHEDTPSLNDEGVVQFITVALGGKMTNSLGMQLSEIWWMQDTGKDRRIAVRNVRQRHPMKTRMFENKTGEFVWRYDAATWEGAGIATWFEQWLHSDGRRIPLPA